MGEAHRSFLGPWERSYAIGSNPSWSLHEMPALAEYFLELAGAGGGVHLDVGCGNGGKTMQFAAAGRQTIGLDPSPAAIALASSRAAKSGLTQRCSFIQGNALAIPMTTASVASASDILMATHLDEWELGVYLAELRRVTVSGAYLLLVLFSDQDCHFHGHAVSKRCTFRFDPANELMAAYEHYDGMYNAHFGQDEIASLLACGGFEHRVSIEVPHPVYSHRTLWNVIATKET